DRVPYTFLDHINLAALSTLHESSSSVPSDFPCSRCFLLIPMKWLVEYLSLEYLFRHVILMERLSNPYFPPSDQNQDLAHLYTAHEQNLMQLQNTPPLIHEKVDMLQ